MSKKKTNYIKDFIEFLDEQCRNEDLESFLWEEATEWKLIGESLDYIDKVKLIKYTSYEEFVLKVFEIFDDASLQLKDNVLESLIQTGEEKFWLDIFPEEEKKQSKPDVPDIREWDPYFHE